MSLFTRRAGIVAAAAVALGLGPAPSLHAQSAQAIVTFEVREVLELNLPDRTEPVLRARGTPRGRHPVARSSTGWTLPTDQTRRKVTARLDRELPPGFALRVALVPVDGTMHAAVPIATTARDLVSDLASLPDRRVGLDYLLSSHPEADLGSAPAPVVTLTILAGA